METDSDSTDSSGDNASDSAAKDASKTGVFTLKGSANALPTVLSACKVSGYENQPDLYQLAKLSMPPTTTTTPDATTTSAAGSDTMREIFNALKEHTSSQIELTNLLEKIFNLIRSGSSLSEVISSIQNINGWQSILNELTQANLIDQAVEAIDGATSQPDPESGNTQISPENIPSTLQKILELSCSQIPTESAPTNGCSNFVPCMVGPTQNWINSQDQVSLQDFGAAILSDSRSRLIEQYMIAVLTQADECMKA